MIGDRRLELEWDLKPTDTKQAIIEPPVSSFKHKTTKKSQHQVIPFTHEIYHMYLGWLLIASIIFHPLYLNTLKPLICLMHKHTHLSFITTYALIPCAFTIFGQQSFHSCFSRLTISCMDPGLSLDLPCPDVCVMRKCTIVMLYNKLVQC